METPETTIHADESASTQLENAADSPRKRRTSLVTWLCWVGLFAEGYDIGILGAILPKLLVDPEWNLSAYSAGILASSALVGMFVGAATVGILSDRYGRRPSFLICLAAFSAAMGASALAPSPTAFAVLRFVCGVGVGGMVPVAAALTTEFAPHHRRSQEFGLMYTGYSLGIFAASLSSYFLLEPLGWRAMIGIGALPLIAMPVIIAWLPESMSFLLAAGKVDKAREISRRFALPMPEIDVSVGQNARRGSPLELFSKRYRRASMSFWATIFASMLVIYGFNTWLPKLMTGAGYDLGPSILFLGVYALASSFGGIALGHLADRYGQRPVIAGGFLLGAIAISGLMVRWPLPMTYFLVACAGVGTVASAVLVTGYQSRHFPVHLRATAIGCCLSFSRVGALSGPLIGAVLISNAVPTAVNFLIFAAFGLLAGIAILFVPPGTDEP